MRMRFFILLGLLAAFFAASARADTAPAPDAADPAPLEELIARARERNLGWDRYWLLLLHYRKHRLWGWSSEQDAPAFFFSEDGKRDPQAELEATLRAFFAPALSEDADPTAQHPQCRFPERYHWLKGQLGFDAARLPDQPCPRFELWRNTIDPGAVTLIFASSYLNNPASLYGHTFIRLDKKNAPPGSDLLSYIVNFSARITSSFSVTYATRGLFGGFDGLFSTEPYYLKVQKYSNIESRDLWEYDLDFNQEQIDRLTRHLWEMGGATFDYWFFDENCSYHLLSLLEVADPNLHLREQYHFWTVPTDTVRSVLDVPGLVKDVRFRPSQYRKLLAYRRALSEEERKIARRIAEEADPERFAALAPLPPQRQAAVLDTADLYLRYRVQAKDETPEAGKLRDREILSRRGAIKLVSEEADVPRPERPDEGHLTSRLAVHFGATRSSTFEEFSFRPTLHDFLSPARGFEPGTHLEMGNTRFRFDNDSRDFTLESFEFFSIFSIWPVDPWSFKLSWKVSTGANLPRELRCFEFKCLAYDVKAGAGVAAKTRLFGGEIYYAFIEAEAAVGHVFDEWVRVGPVASGGVLLALTPRWRAHASGRYLYPLTGSEPRPENGYFTEHAHVWHVRVETAVDLLQNLDLRAYGQVGTARDEIGGSLNWYF